MTSERFPRYDWKQSYDWNYEHAPEPLNLEVPAVLSPIGKRWSFCGSPVGSPLGMPAGPLLNGRWILYYASLGFDILTYKTVRSVERACYPLPNLQPISVSVLHGDESAVPASDQMEQSWAVSFGMPSKPPDQWRKDIEETKRRLPSGKVLVVSVVGTMQPGWSLDDLADDYAKCARWAVDAGADAVETNFSCPNVLTCDGQLYEQPASAALVGQRVRSVLGATPYLVKIGYLANEGQAKALVEAIGPYVDAMAMTNCVPVTIAGPDGRLMFDGQRRGIGGSAILEASLAQVRRFARFIEQAKLGLKIVGVGGISSTQDVSAYLAAGAETVQLATSAMLDPAIALTLRKQLAEG